MTLTTLADPDFLWDYVNDNRERLRTLIGVLINIATILTSAAGLLLFFAVDKGVHHWLIVPALSGAMLALVLSLSFGVVALIPGKRKPVPTRTVALDIVMTRYRFEEWCAKASATLLIAALATASLSFGIFTVTG